MIEIDSISSAIVCSIHRSRLFREKERKLSEWNEHHHHFLTSIDHDIDQYGYNIFDERDFLFLSFFFILRYVICIISFNFSKFFSFSLIIIFVSFCFCSLSISSIIVRFSVHTHTHIIYIDSIHENKNKKHMNEFIFIIIIIIIIVASISTFDRNRLYHRSIKMMIRRKKDT